MNDETDDFPRRSLLDPWHPLAPLRKEDGTTWAPMAPVNVTADGRRFIKTRFGDPNDPNDLVEWMWVQQDDPDAVRSGPLPPTGYHFGTLQNDAAYRPELRRGMRVIYRVIPKGEDFHGCGDAVGIVG